MKRRLAVGVAFLAALALFRMLQVQPPRAPESRTVGGVAVTVPPPMAPRIETPPPAAETADATRKAELRRQVMLALAADPKARPATLAALRKDRHNARAVIGEMIRRANNPEYMRQLDLLDEEVGAP